MKVKNILNYYIHFDEVTDSGIEHVSIDKNRRIQ